LKIQRHASSRLTSVNSAPSDTDPAVERVALLDVLLFECRVYEERPKE